MERFSALKSQVGETFGRFSPGQRIGLLAAMLITMGGLLWIAFSASSTPHRTLYSDLSPATISKILDELDSQQIPYEIVGTTTITVPEDRIYEARIHLAGQGLPDVEGSGYELFDESDFGMTAFTQKVNYQRALENELARTIRHLNSVRAVRVHLVLPKDALFRDEQLPPSASVVLTLNSGMMPDNGQIQSIRHMVASAVEGLDPRQITIVDSTGRMLARPTTGGADSVADFGESFQAARAMETDLEARIVDLLEPILGRQYVRAKVRVELDTAQVTETSESFDPDQIAVRSEQRTEETDERNTQVLGGMPGAAANLPGREGDDERGLGSRRAKSNELVNYEVNKTIRQMVQSGFHIRRLSVAVLLDDRLQPGAPPAAEGDESEGQEVADVSTRTPEEIERISALVANVVGIDPTRGDRIEVIFDRFNLPEYDVEEMVWWQNEHIINTVIRYAFMFAIAFLLWFLILRPLIKAIGLVPTTSAATGGAVALAGAGGDIDVIGRTVGELETELGGRGDAAGKEAGMRASNEMASSVPGTVQKTASQPLPGTDHERLRFEVIELCMGDMERAKDIIVYWAHTK